MDFAKGYHLPADLDNRGDDIGGPMNLGEEYRWNVPIITYGFDEAFLNFFGTNGVLEVEKAIAIAQRHAAAQNLSIKYLVGTGEALPLADGSMDYVVCVDVLEHVADLGGVINEVRRVLKPGGLFLFDTINRTWLANLVLVFFGERIFRILPVGTHDPTIFIAPANLATRLKACGFSVSEFTGLGPRGLNRKLDFVFGTLPSTMIMYIGHAKRDSD